MLMLMLMPMLMLMLMCLSLVCHQVSGDVVQLPLHATNPSSCFLCCSIFRLHFLAPPWRNPDVRHLLVEAVIGKSAGPHLCNILGGVLRDFSHKSPVLAQN